MAVLSIDRPRADSGAEPRVSRRQSRIPGKDSVARTNSVRLAWRLTGRSEELRVIAAALADPHVSESWCVAQPGSVRAESPAKP